MDLGSFTEWQPLARNARFEVLLAKGIWSPRGQSFALKLVNDPQPVVIARFKAAVARQQSAIHRGCRGIAPIFHDGPAYVVTPHYGWSVLAISEDGAYRGRWLFVLVASLLATLTQLQKKAHMSHGNLKASNIFCPSYPSVSQDEIFLTDFSSDDHATPGGDLRAVGRIINALVEGKGIQPSIRPFTFRRWAYWKYFGWDCFRWVAFCKLLDSPLHADHPQALEIFSDQLSHLNPDRRSAKFKSPLLLLLLAVFALTMAVCSFLPSDPTDAPNASTVSPGPAMPVQDTRPDGASETLAKDTRLPPNLWFEKKHDEFFVRSSASAESDAPLPANVHVDYVDPSLCRRPLEPGAALPLPASAHSMPFFSPGFVPVYVNLDSSRGTMGEGTKGWILFKPSDCARELAEAEKLYTGHTQLRTTLNAARLGRLCIQAGYSKRGSERMAEAKDKINLSVAMTLDDMQSSAQAAREIYLAGDQEKARQLWSDLLIAALGRALAADASDPAHFDQPLQTCVGIGICAAQAGDLEQANQCVSLIEKFLRQRVSHAAMGPIFNAIGAFCLRQRRYEKVLQLAEGNDSPLIKHTLVADAISGLLSVGQVERALAVAKSNRVVNWDRRETISVLLRCGHALAQKKDAAGAERFFAEAEQEAVKHPDEAWRAYLQTGVLVARGWHQPRDQAVPGCSSALALRKQSLALFDKQSVADPLPSIAALLAWQGATDKTIPLLKDLAPPQALQALLFIRDRRAREKLHAELAATLGSFVRIDQEAKGRPPGGSKMDMSTFVGLDSGWPEDEETLEYVALEPAFSFAWDSMESDVKIKSALIRFFVRTGQSRLLEKINSLRPQDLFAGEVPGGQNHLVRLLASHEEKLASDLCEQATNPESKFERLMDVCDGKLDLTDGALSSWQRLD